MTSSNSELNDCLQKYKAKTYSTFKTFNFHIKQALLIRFDFQII